MKPQFVTAIYTGLEGTRYNGNAQGGIYERYKQSLRSLAAGGYAIVCYTAPETFDELSEYYKDFPNMRLESFDLSKMPIHKSVESIKDKKPKYYTEDSWRSRCVEIMWGKFYWISQHVSDLDENDSIFWIDAGIFHGGLISNTLRSEASTNFYDFDTITQHRNLHEDLVQFTKDLTILNIRSQQVNHGSDDYSEVFGNRPEYGICAGVFGGRKYDVIEYLRKFFDECHLTLDKEFLLKEEEIMYFLHQKEPKFYSTFAFNNWYHEDWGSPLYDASRGHVSFSDFFKVIRG